MAWEKFEYAETDTVMPALIMVIDELAQFVDDVPRSQMRLADEFQGNIQKIARLGRSAHVHVILATQSASSNLFPPSLKNNIAFRNICGRVEANISRMAIDSEEAESLPLTPGSYLAYSKGETQPYQGWYTPTKEVLALGTVKPGFDPKTGLPILDEEEFDFSKPIEDDDEDEETSYDEFDVEDGNAESNEEDRSDDPYDFSNAINIDDLLDDGDNDDSSDFNDDPFGFEESSEEYPPLDDDFKQSKTSFKLNVNSSSSKPVTQFKLNKTAPPTQNKKREKGSITIE